MKKITFIMILLVLITPISVIGETISDLEKSINSVEEEYNKMSEELDKNEQSIEELTKQLETLSGEMQTTENELDQTKSNITEINTRITKLEKVEIPQKRESLEVALIMTQKVQNSKIVLEILFDDSESSDPLAMTRSNSLIDIKNKTTKDLEGLTKLLNEIASKEKELEDSKNALEIETATLQEQEAYLKELESKLAQKAAELENNMANSQDIIEAEKNRKELFENAGCGENDVYGVDCGEGSIPDVGSGGSGGGETGGGSGGSGGGETGGGSGGSGGGETGGGSGGGTTTTGFQRPIKSGVVTQEFGYNDAYNTGLHSGIDLAGNSSIYASAPGVVLYSGATYDGGGNSVIILHLMDGKNIVTRYCHMSNVSVSSNQNVNYNTKIGTMGATGNAYGVHLHFEVQPYSSYVWESSRFVNPRNYVSFPALGVYW